MKKKIFALCLCIALAATAIAGASLAYFTDTARADNTFTSGNVDIKLIEQDRNGNEFDIRVAHKLLPFTGDLANYEYTTDKNFVDKIVMVETMSYSEDAYIRVLYGIPAAANGAIVVVDNNRSKDGSTPAASPFIKVKLDQQMEYKGIVYDIYQATYKEPVAAGSKTPAPAMVGLYLDPSVDFNHANGKYTLNGQDIDLKMNNVVIPVAAQAVQVQGFKSADEAFTAAYGAGNLTALPEGWTLVPKA